MGVSSHEGETEVEVLLELCGDRVIVTVYVNVLEIVRSRSSLFGYSLCNILRPCRRLARKAEASRILDISETGSGNAGEVLVDDSFEGGLYAARKVCVDSER